MKVGDKVEVMDSGLIRLFEIMKKFNPHAVPGNLGWVDEICEDGTIMVKFPVGSDDPDEHSQVAPYPADIVIKKDW